jgi:hypothetical protein
MSDQLLATSAQHIDSDVNQLVVIGSLAYGGNVGSARAADRVFKIQSAYDDLSQLVRGSKSQAAADFTLQLIEAKACKKSGATLPVCEPLMDITVWELSALIARSVQAETRAGKAIGNELYDSGLYSAVRDLFGGH